MQKPSTSLQIPMLESQAVHEIPPVLRMNFWGNPFYYYPCYPYFCRWNPEKYPPFWMLVIPQTGWLRLHQVLPPFDWGLAQKALLLRGSETAIGRDMGHEAAINTPSIGRCWYQTIHFQEVHDSNWRWLWHLVNFVILDLLIAIFRTIAGCCFVPLLASQ